MKWFEPKDMRDWFRRGVSLRLGLLLFVVVILVATEFWFNWLEKAVGTYLVTTNSDRPESGAIWDLGHQTQSARKNLAEIVSGSQTSQKEARGAESFSQIITELGDDNGISISAAHFRKLYDKLPAVLSQELLSPYSLLQMESQGEWVRTYFTKDEKEVRIYLLDKESKVLKEVSIAPDLVDYISQGEIAVSGTLKSFADFADHIFPPDIFFTVLETLPEEVRRAILPQPQMLLNARGELVNVGISSEEVGGVVAIGFEYEQSGTHKVILIQGRQEDVDILRTRLSQWQSNASGSSELE